jgi:hypothetical protein
MSSGSLGICSVPYLHCLVFTPLQDFLGRFSRALVADLAPEIPEDRLDVSFATVFSSVVATSKQRPLDIRLEFKHVCK